MKKSENVLIIIVFMLLALPLVSAFEFDNLKYYNDTTRTVTVKNSILKLIPLGVAAEIKAISPQENFVIDKGQDIAQLVYEFQIKNNVDDYSNPFKLMEYYDRNNNMRSVEREIFYKYKQFYNVTEPIYETVCDTQKVTNVSGTFDAEVNCRQEILRYQTVEKFNWIDLDTSKLPEGILHIGLFTDVEPNESIEFIPTWFGLRMPEYATWTASLNVNLQAYYSLDGSFSPLEDIYDFNNNASSENGGKVQIPGKIGNASNFTAQSSSSATAGYFNVTNPYMFFNSTLQPFTICNWVKLNALTCNKGWFTMNQNKSTASTNPEIWFYNSDAGGEACYPAINYQDDSGGSLFIRDNTETFTSNHDWTHLCAVYDGISEAANMRLYRNGTPVTTTTVSDTLGDDATLNVWGVFIGSAKGYYGSGAQIDEVAVWNRNLSGSEISDLWNNGNGLQYSAGETVPPNVTINFPLNTTYVGSEINFNVTAVDTTGVNTCWFNIGTTNYTMTNLTVTDDYNYTLSGISAGSYKANFYCNDSNNNLNDSEVSHFSMNAYPNITFLYPLNASYNSEVTVINYSFNESNCDSVWYSTNEGKTNSTRVNCGTNFTGLSSFPGSNNWTLYINDTSDVQNSTDISFIYNLAPIINVYAPNNLTDYAGDNVTLDWSVTDNTGTVDTVWYVYNAVNTTLSGAVGTDVINLTTNTSYVFYANDSNGLLNSTTITMDYKVFENSRTFNPSALQTEIETFSINVTANASLTDVNLIYSGVSYDTIQSVDVWSTTVNISGTGAQSFNWEFNYSGSTYNSTWSSTQTIGIPTFRICNNTINVPYINFTFINEGNSSAASATLDSSTWYWWIGAQSNFQTYTFSNSTVNPSYGFCFNPPNRILQQNVSLIYSAPGNPSRRFQYGQNLTNSSTNLELFLLGTADGLYSIYQIQDEISGNTISGVYVTAERIIDGNWETVDSAFSDAAGSVTFWLNPDFDHRLTFVRSGYTTLQLIVRPSSTTYSVIMSPTGGQAAVYNASTEGMLWKFSPALGTLTPNQIYTFEFNITSNISDLTECKLELLNNASVVLGTATGCNARGGNLSISLNVTTNRSIRGRYSINLGDGFLILDTDAYWSVFSINVPNRGTINAFFKNLRRINQFGSDDNRQEFSRIVFFFFILFLLFSVVSYKTNWDFATTGGCLIVLFPIILGASVAGFLTLSYQPATQTSVLQSFMNQYTVALISGLITFGYVLNTWGGKTPLRG